MNEVQRLSLMHPNENFLGEMDDWIHDIKCIDKEFGGVRGICLPESRRTCTFLNRHENETDVKSTMRHESIHCICSDEYDISEVLWDIEQEHEMIRNISWAEEMFDKNTYYSIIDGEHVKPSIKEDEYKKLVKKYNKMADKIEECN